MPRVKPPLERDVAKAVVEAFACCGIALERHNVGMGTYANKDGSARRVRFGAAGQLDWRGSVNGRVLELEIKRPGEKPTKDQLARMRRVNAEGGIAFWTDCAAVAIKVAPLLLKGWRAAERREKPGHFIITDDEEIE
jgi:hypothetical protein